MFNYVFILENHRLPSNQPLYPLFLNRETTPFPF